MNTAITVVLWIIALSTVALTVLLVLVLQQIRELVIHVKGFVDRLDTELPGLVAQVRETSQNVSDFTKRFDDTLDEAGAILAGLKNVTGTAMLAAQLVRGGVSSASTYTRSILAGIKAAYDYVSKHHAKGGNKNGG